ncbi:hypothetical protein [Paenibacillus sp. SI8]|uniref:hypothetical protein n=1 Tax=unclassified Paenibacillus TaxID=185978 RepID=UPI003467CD9F
MTFEISDWVKGKTEIGELIQGYIESIHDVKVNVNVLQSDNEEIIGTIISVPKHRLKKQTVISLQDEGLIKALIDIALTARDEAWFLELSERLRLIEQPASPIETISTAFLPSTNRLGSPGMK